MKHLLISVLTFTIGLFAFNLWQPRKVEKTITISYKTATELVEKTENVPVQSIKLEKPFFDSFGENLYDEESNYQGYSGWFIPDDFKGMPEVWTILLSRDVDENSKTEKPVWSAMVLTQYKDGSSNDDADFHSVWIKTEKNHLSFRTNIYHGVEYRFDGKFFKKGNNFSDVEKVLKGTMQKFVKGKKVAEFTDDFAYYEPHCFH